LEFPKFKLIHWGKHSRGRANDFSQRVSVAIPYNTSMILRMNPLHSLFSRVKDKSLVEHAMLQLSLDPIQNKKACIVFASIQPLVFNLLGSEECTLTKSRRIWGFELSNRIS
jgi:hypothetical protein